MSLLPQDRQWKDEEFLLDSTLINGLREVAELVSLARYSYLVVLLPDVILDAYGAGLIAGGASWVLDTSTQTEPERTITQIETTEPGKIVTLWTAVPDLNLSVGYAPVLSWRLFLDTFIDISITGSADIWGIAGTRKILTAGVPDENSFTIETDISHQSYQLVELLGVTYVMNTEAETEAEDDDAT